MTSKNEDQNRNCFERALRLLDERAHTVTELRRKLRGKEFAPNLIDEAIQELLRLGLLNDAEFARAFIREKMMSSRQVGTYRIIADLQRRGIDRSEIDRALRDVRDCDSPPDEVERARAAFERKKNSLRTTETSRESQIKIRRFLVNRGFSADTIRQVMEP